MNLKKKNNFFLDLFFFSMLFRKFVNKVFILGLKYKLENILLNSIFFLSFFRIFKKPFFFIYFHLFDSIKMNFSLITRVTYKKSYSFPSLISFNSRYKNGLKICKNILKNYLNNLKIKNKIKNFFFFLFLTFILNEKNFFTTKIKILKRKIGKNRVNFHWRWKRS